MDIELTKLENDTELTLRLPPQYHKLVEHNRVLKCQYGIAQIAVDDHHSFDTALHAIIDIAINRRYKLRNGSKSLTPY